MKVIASNDETRILAFLQANDDSFSPALSTKVNLKNYAKKLSSNAVNLFLLSENSFDAGHAAVYINNGDTSFLSSFCLQKTEHGTGAALCLLNDVYRCCLNENSALLELEVDSSNTRAIRFYQKHGFSVFKHLSNSLLMRKSLDAIS